MDKYFYTDNLALKLRKSLEILLSSFKIITDKLKKYRHLTDAEVAQVAQGQVILGEEAQRLKIVDELGNFYVAVDHLAKKVNVSKPELVFYRKDQSFLQSFLDHGIQSAKMMIGL